LTYTVTTLSFHRSAAALTFARSRVCAFSARSTSAGIDAGFEWKRDAGVINSNRASPWPGQHREPYRRDHLRKHGDNILCRCGLFWIGWRETDPACHPGGTAGGSRGCDRVSRDLPCGALMILEGQALRRRVSLRPGSQSSPLRFARCNDATVLTFLHQAAKGGFIFPSQPRGGFSIVTFLK